jgi:hypothetical protein
MAACSSASDKRKAERDVMHQETMADLTLPIKMDLAQDASHKSTKGFLNRAARTVVTFVVTKVNSFESVTVNRL